ncbi:fumarylacetoacetate hydrolase family protein [Streptomyces sp. NPDC056716]|uniref:fumarylacetoacetate hydrolase family protein n=1 Tax=unclassified Streptomyces TaxID=2593676 RepID=UPI0036B65415
MMFPTQPLPAPSTGVPGRWYALATVEIDGRTQPGLLLEDGTLIAPPELAATTVKELLNRWDTAQPDLAELAARPGPPVPSGTLLTPVRYPDSLIAVGANYAGHLKEMGLEVKRWVPMPFFHCPPRSRLVGPGATVRIPDSTTQFDWECELAVVVGRTLRHASRDEARAAIAGYSIGLDLTCRDLIQVDGLGLDLARGKSQDSMAPCGPAVVPARFIPDDGDLRITLSVNDEPMMDASTKEMLYPVDEVLAEISRHNTLRPGDIVFTGSPAGSAGDHGGRWLRPGDRIDAAITGIPTLTVTMTREDS